MKSLGIFFKNSGLKALLLFFNILLASKLLAQEKSINVDVNSTGTGAWYTAWWIWVALALFVIVVIAIVSAGKRT